MALHGYGQFEGLARGLLGGGYGGVPERGTPVQQGGGYGGAPTGRTSSFGATSQQFGGTGQYADLVRQLSERYRRRQGLGGVGVGGAGAGPAAGVGQQVGAGAGQQAGTSASLGGAQPAPVYDTTPPSYNFSPPGSRSGSQTTNPLVPNVRDFAGTPGGQEVVDKLQATRGRAVGPSRVAATDFAGHYGAGFPFISAAKPSTRPSVAEEPPVTEALPPEGVNVAAQSNWPRGAIGDPSTPGVFIYQGQRYRPSSGFGKPGMVIIEGKIYELV